LTYNKGIEKEMIKMNWDLTIRVLGIIEVLVFVGMYISLEVSDRKDKKGGKE
jgi:hypothetical protein